MILHSRLQFVVEKAAPGTSINVQLKIEHAEGENSAELTVHPFYFVPVVLLSLCILR